MRAAPPERPARLRLCRRASREAVLGPACRTRAPGGARVRFELRGAAGVAGDWAFHVAEVPAECRVSVLAGAAQGVAVSHLSELPDAGAVHAGLWSERVEGARTV